MGLTASLDIGSEKMVMALAATADNSCRLTGIKFVASQGVERGIITDKPKVRACVRTLLSELVKDKPLDTLNIALPGNVLQLTDRTVSVNLQRKVVERGDLDRAEMKCAELAETGRGELVDIIPVSYAIDRGVQIADPIGRNGRSLEAIYQVYSADNAYLADIRRMFDGCDIREINFFPATRVYAEAADAETSDKDFALIDLGASCMKIVLFRDGMLEYDALLPLGAHTIDNDLVNAFAIDAAPARKLKHEYGQALRSSCKNKKVSIPDTNLTVDSRDVATVVQSRAEELLEGIVYLLQKWGFEASDGEILLTGGGSRLQDIQLLLHRLSGHQVAKAAVKNLQTPKEEVLVTPEYFIALGLLLCRHQEPQENKSGIGSWFNNFFGKNR